MGSASSLEPSNAIAFILGSQLLVYAPFCIHNDTFVWRVRIVSSSSIVVSTFTSTNLNPTKLKVSCLHPNIIHFFLSSFCISLSMVANEHISSAMFILCRLIPAVKIVPASYQRPLTIHPSRYRKSQSYVGLLRHLNNERS